MTANAPFFISCIVPARNEEGNIAKVVDALSPVLASSPLIRDYEIIIVNDNSTDSTGRLIDSLAEKDLHIRPVHRTSSPGFGNAVKSGMAEAKGDIVIPFMGDLSDNPRDIPRLVERIG
ncbi:MAG: glycosyltransferase family 2 protein, partial [Methanoregula sp.]